MKTSFPMLPTGFEKGIKPRSAHSASGCENRKPTTDSRQAPETESPGASARPRARIEFELLNSDRFRPSAFGFRPSAERFRAFTLIELLVVIAIIAVLAALLFPAGIAVRNRATLSRAKAEVKLVEAAITAYKIDKGFYPPDNPLNTTAVWRDRLYLANLRTPSLTNTLYYELRGAQVPMPAPAIPRFITMDGSEAVTNAQLQVVFGINGINNMQFVADNAGQLEVTPDSPGAKDFLSAFSASLYKPVDFGANRRFRLMGVDIDGPILVQAVGGGDINPFRYVSTSPTNNTETFDLWVDVLVGGKTNRVCNWSDAPIVNP